MSLRKILAATGGALLLFHMALTAGGYNNPAHWLKARLTDPQLVKLSMALELNGFRSAPLLSTPEPIVSSPVPTAAPTPTPSAEPLPEILPTSASGGLTIKNATDYDVTPAQLLADGTELTLSADQPQILIIHTHSSEAYTMDEVDRYDPSDTLRTQDTHYNIIRVGDELTTALESYGLHVIHDRGIYDYPSYTGSYNRTGDAISAYLQQYPTLSMVIDLHRDAIGTGDVIYKTVAENEGIAASQVMFVVGSNGSGLDHPNWQKNLRLAVYLQNAVCRMHPSLMRPIQLVNERYNQQLTNGSLILEVGSSGNTLQEALNAIRMFAEAAGPALVQRIQ